MTSSEDGSIPQPAVETIDNHALSPDVKALVDALQEHSQAQYQSAHSALGHATDALARELAKVELSNQKSSDHLINALQTTIKSLQETIDANTDKLSAEVYQIISSIKFPNTIEVTTPPYDTAANYLIGITPFVVGVAAYYIGKKQNELISIQNSIQEKQNDLYQLDIAQRTYGLKAKVYGKVRDIFDSAISNPNKTDFSGTDYSSLLSEARFLFSDSVVRFVKETIERSVRMIASSRTVSQLEPIIQSGRYTPEQLQTYNKYAEENQTNLEWFANKLAELDDVFVAEMKISQ